VRSRGATAGAEATGARLLVVVPAFDEAAAVGDVVRSVPRELSGVARVDVLVVDDGSSDATGAEARAAGADVIRHDVNRGLGRAFQTALDAALARGVDVMVNVDADGQFDPREIGALVAPILAAEADFVAGDRFSGGRGRPEHMPRLKYWGNALVSWLVGRIARRRFPDVSSGFRAYSREALLWLNLHGAFTYTQESFLDLATKGLAIRQVPVAVRYTPERRSKVAGSLVRYALFAGTIVLRTFRDYQPLRFFGLLGAACLAPALALGAFVARHYLMMGSFTPYKSVAFAAAYMATLTVVLWVLAVVADMLDRLRSNQERLLYWQKRAALARERPAAAEAPQTPGVAAGDESAPRSRVPSD